MAGRLACVTGAVLLLAGCAGSSAGGMPVSEQGDYPAGYADGCRTAGARGSQIPETPVRNKALFEQSEGYRAGWRAGYGACGGSFDPVHR